MDEQAEVELERIKRDTLTPNWKYGHAAPIIHEITSREGPFFKIRRWLLREEVSI